MTRRALTLIETLAALVLLAALSVAAAALFRDALGSTRDRPPTIQMADLDALADDALVHPEAHGLTGDLIRSASLRTTLPGGPGLPPVRLTTLRADGADHAWLRFECAGRAAIRYMPIREPRR